MSLGVWNPPTNLTLTAVKATGGAFTNGITNIWYSLSITNLLGRTSTSEWMEVSFIGSSLTNSVKLVWDRYDGAKRLIVLKSFDAGTNSTWIDIAPNLITFTDTGAFAFTNNIFTDQFPLITAITVPWSDPADMSALVETTAQNTASIIALSDTTAQHTVDISALAVTTGQHTASIAALVDTTSQHTVSILALAVTTTQHTVDLGFLTNTQGVQNTAITNQADLILQLQTNRFDGDGSTGTVTSLPADAGKFLKADGSWDTPATGATPSFQDVANIGSTITNSIGVSNIVAADIEASDVSVTNLDIANGVTFAPGASGLIQGPNTLIAIGYPTNVSDGAVLTVWNVGSANGSRVTVTSDETLGGFQIFDGPSASQGSGALFADFRNSDKTFYVTNGGNAVVTGTLEGGLKKSLDTAASVTLTNRDCLGSIRFNNDDDDIEYILPPPEVALVEVVTFSNTQFDRKITINLADDTSQFLLDGVLLAAGSGIESPLDRKAKVTVTPISTGIWMVFSKETVWIVVP